MKPIVTLIVLAVLVTACNSKQKETKEEKQSEIMETKKELSNKEKATALLESLETGDQTPISYINPNKYIQHNLSVGDGLAGFGEVMKNAPEDGFKAKVVRSFEDGDYTFSHTIYDFFGPKVGFDIFRFEDGKIVEHWDNLAELTQVNPSGHTQTDGAEELKDLDKTKSNKALVDDFLNTVLVNGGFDKMANYFDGDNYIQHNSMIGDGLSGLGKALEEMAKNGVTMVYNKVHKVLGEGNFVLAVSEGKFAGKHTSFYDLFRIENGKIAEHWDIIEAIAPEDTWKNTNGKFDF
ncbi:nuclear transport factor 2 family protein [Winogradskyella flava]|uniref:Nuclear transport factor 2 family protein n=1 Tax=Winogradskyella flava TaxID=1884876 RepID=A0A842IM32_9FLAO|nr:nuclear transport factor 2 family protein [Winogradskyella flava]MBC2843781.1 nuclear transport factor 2 family protein [Winogradskyella flava]